jgi:pyrimidine deaminase RibD-like protein
MPSRLNQERRPTEKMDPKDLNLMREAIAWAKICYPTKPGIPKVGAIIAVDGEVIGRGHRGSGIPGDDHHAELNALKDVEDRTKLGKATVYTTLEPCTPEVRSEPMLCCTELIRQAEVKKVFIGILDPNQGVRGKGLWELQDRGIEVELFPPELAKEIRVLNDVFIRTQRQYGITIVDPTPGQVLRTHTTDGVYHVRGTFLNPPREDVFAFVVGPNGDSWPQDMPLMRLANTREWQVPVRFGMYGPHTIYIIKANDLGIVLAKYYRKVLHTNIERKEQLKGHLQLPTGVTEEQFLRGLHGDFQGIEIGTVPKGLEIQASVAVEVHDPRR